MSSSLLFTLASPIWFINVFESFANTLSLPEMFRVYLNKRLCCQTTGTTGYYSKLSLTVFSCHDIRQISIVDTVVLNVSETILLKVRYMIGNSRLSTNYYLQPNTWCKVGICSSVVIETWKSKMTKAFETETVTETSPPKTETKPSKTETSPPETKHTYKCVEADFPYGMLIPALNQKISSRELLLMA